MMKQLSLLAAGLMMSTGLLAAAADDEPLPLVPAGARSKAGQSARGLLLPLN